jgi:hypothetical protein
MATDAQTRFHDEWLGFAQPYEGLVFSVPVLADAQITPQVGADLTARFRRALVTPDEDSPGHFGDLQAFFADFLGYDRPGALVPRSELPTALHFYAQEGGQDLRPSFAIARTLPEPGKDDLFGSFGDEPTPREPIASGSGDSPWLALVWDVRDDAGKQALGLNLDKPEEQTGPWRYPPTAKFERLLRAVGVPIGLLCNGRDLRLVYAPAGESIAHLTFRGEFLQRPDGRSLLAAFELLLGATRTYEASAEFTLEGLLKESRSRQADVTKELAGQVFEAVELLLSGFEAAANRDSSSGRHDSLRAALEEPHDHAYQGVLSVVLRLVFLLYAEDQGLLPVQNDTYARHLSVKGLYDELMEDAGQHPESMHHRFGAYGRLLSLFRSVFFGVRHGDLQLPPRRGRLFDPNSFPFLEGRLPDSTAPHILPEERAATKPPSVDDGTVYEVLHRLIFFQGQRLSYASLDVEQLGSVYESLMGYHVLRTVEPAVRLGKKLLWVELKTLRAETASDRKKLLKEEAGLSDAQVTRVEGLLKEHAGNDTLAEALNELSPGKKKQRHRHRAGIGRLVLQPGEERRRSGSHYTPRSLTEGIVRRTLEPLLCCLGETPTEAQILSLKICDPAMGSGAFLVEVVRQLGAKLVDIWTREGQLAAVTEKYENPHLHAQRLVAQQCVYGVDKNAAAVELAKLSLWLVTLSADLPFTFVDHALRHGDSLVGLDLEQIASFHWKPTEQVPLLHQLLEDALDEALEHRAELLELAKDDSPRSQEERRRLLDHAEQALDRVRTIADVCIGAFFAESTDKARNAERVQRMDLVERWLNGDKSVEPELRELALETRERLSPFHWMLEFPEVFYEERPDPLDECRVDSAAMMDGFVGNPPFMGGKTISTNHGDSYSEWLQSLHSAGKNGDLSAHFFRRTGSLLGRHGTIGLVATNTIGQGDTRQAGLQQMCHHGFAIHAAQVDVPWPGEAAVTVSVVHVARGRPTVVVESELNGVRVQAINSRLRPKPERPDPSSLRSNEGTAYVGSYVLGMGFVLAPEEREQLLAADRRNSECIFPYLGGEDINSSPTQDYDRYVISFGRMSLEEASRWPKLMERIRSTVKPERDKVRREAHRKHWWHYADKRPELYAAIAPLSRCLVTARVTKHLCFSFQPTDRILNEKLYVFPFESLAPFSVLQSRIHGSWTWMLSSTLKTDLNYSASDCFETFAFPEPDPRAVIPELEAIGEKLYDTRAKYMVDTDQGLTKTYNALKDPNCADERILALRELHEEMDRAVLRAYPRLPQEGADSNGTTSIATTAINGEVIGWSDIPVPPFCIVTDEDWAALQAFEDEVIDRLFVLNELRAKEEAGHANGASKRKKKKGPTRPPKKPKQPRAPDGGEQDDLF